MRFCRMRKLEEDHAQANYPLNSPEALINPSRPSSNTVKRQKTEDGVVKSEEIDIDDMIMQDWESILNSFFLISVREPYNVITSAL